MRNGRKPEWENLIVNPAQVMKKLEPGMSIFLGTGVGEPRTLVKHLMSADSNHLKDLELIQLVNLGNAISVEALNSNAYRLKTFFSGWVAGEAITAGQVDLIPSSFSRIPRYIESGRIPIDVAFVVDEKYQGLGIATYLYRMLIRLAKDRGIQGLTADVLASNKGMMKVFEKGETTVTAKLDCGVYHLTIPLDAQQTAVKSELRDV